jgi:WD40 repeat protein
LMRLGHPGNVISARFGPDGRSVAVATTHPTSTLRVLDLTNLTAPATRFIHSYPAIRSMEWSLRSMELSQDGHWLAVGDDRGDIRLIDFESGQELATLTGHDGPVISLAISPDGKNIASGSEDGVVRMFRVPDAVTAGGK